MVDLSFLINMHHLNSIGKKPNELKTHNPQDLKIDEYHMYAYMHDCCVTPTDIYIHVHLFQKAKTERLKVAMISVLRYLVWNDVQITN